MKRYRTITLGCKVNQCESAAIGHLLEKTGLKKANDESAPDLIVINTCTVTGKAAMQSRQNIRKAVRTHPFARIVVTGCYAQTDANLLQAMEGVDLVVSNVDKMEIAKMVCSPAESSPACHPHSICHGTVFSSLPSVSCEGRTRAFLKVQDGCNTHCTYCIVPYARGRSRSMPMEDVFTHMRGLGIEGFHEVVLTGIHLGAYGADLTPSANLTELLRNITSVPVVDRIRLSSIEPTEVSEDLLQLFETRRDFLCRHFHIPLQSGDNTILRRMGRPYTHEQFSHVINRIHHLFPQAGIGIDVMAGFPGETDDAFDNTFKLIATLPITYLHVFPFSPRKGTPAAGFKNKVPEKITKERCLRLRRLGEEKHNAFLLSMIGQTLKILIQTFKNTPDGYSQGLSDNYLPVLVNDENCPENTLVSVRIQQLSPQNLLIGTPIEL